MEEGDLWSDIDMGWVINLIGVINLYGRRRCIWVRDITMSK